MILAINTAQKVHELALISESNSSTVAKILSEKIWTDAKDDVEKLTPTLAGMLEEIGSLKSEIDSIVVVSGPGSFTSLRTGVAFANALASGLGAKLFSVDSFELLAMKAAISDPLIVVLNAGGLDVGIRVYNLDVDADSKKEKNKATEIGSLAELLAKFPHEKFSVVSECTETQSDELHSICLEKKWKEIKGHELQTFAESILTFDFKNLAAQKTVEPYYLRPPLITKSQDKWKQ